MTDLQTIWQERLTHEAEGLDLTDPEDRVIFRLRVQNALRLAKMAVMQEILGIWTAQAPRNRNKVVRLVADTFIQQRQET